MKKLLIVFFMAVVCLFAATTSNIASNTTSTVNFEFDGLQALCFGDSSRVSDGILDVAHHTPNIEIKRTERGKTTTVASITAEMLKNKTLSISTPNTSLKPTRYYSADMAKDATDFRWTLDLESDLFQKQLYLKESKLFAKVHFLTGTFHATNLSKEKYTFQAGTIQSEFNRRIAAPAARVELQPGATLTISGLDKPISLPYESGVTYQVAITNLPPPDHADMNHFLFYYDAFRTPVTQFVPVIVKKANYFPPPMVCGPVGLSKSVIK